MDLEAYIGTWWAAGDATRLDETREMCKARSRLNLPMKLVVLPNFFVDGPHHSRKSEYRYELNSCSSLPMVLSVIELNSTSLGRDLMLILHLIWSGFPISTNFMKNKKEKKRVRRKMRWKSGATTYFNLLWIFLQCALFYALYNNRLRVWYFSLNLELISHFTLELDDVWVIQLSAPTLYKNATKLKESYDYIHLKIYVHK